MAATGRILQVVGWLWFLAGIVGPAFEFDSLNPFPGLVLIFIARILRTRARSKMPGPVDVEAEPQAQPVRAPRREPRQETPPPSPETRPETRPTAGPRPELEYERPVDERNELLERIAMAGREATAEPDVPEPKRQGPGSRKEESKPIDAGKKPMSSAEMIAQARKRWDRDKP